MDSHMLSPLIPRAMQLHKYHYVTTLAVSCEEL